MKVFIMFLAFMLIFTGFLAYTSDMSRFTATQVRLKNLAEDCAAASALVTDENAYSVGKKVIDQEGAERITEAVIAMAEAEGWFSHGKISYSLMLFDDEKGYEGCAERGLDRNRPAAEVILTYSCPDIFRLGFIEKTSVKRAAVYQWEN